MTTGGVTRYVRFTQGGRTSYGIREGATIRELEGDLFANPRPTGRTASVSAVKLEVPVDPLRVKKVIGVAGNWNMPDRPPRVPGAHPRVFAKFATGLVPHEAEVEQPPECKQLHHQAELVVVIGRQGRYISREEANDYIFGVTVGNDVSDETYYGEPDGVKNPGRIISKACDTWAPLGTDIVAGLDYHDLGIEARLDGEVVSKGRTSEMLYGVEKVVSAMSHYLTLMPGDLFYMGSPPWYPGKRDMFAGQTIECEIEGIGVLRNKIVAMQNVIPDPWWKKEEAKVTA